MGNLFTREVNEEPINEINNKQPDETTEEDYFCEF